VQQIISLRKGHWQNGRWQFGLAVLAVAALLFVALLVNQQSLRSNLDDTARQAQNTLQLASTSLRGHMTRFERLPPLLADQPLVRALAARPDDPALVAQTNTFLADVALQLGASDIYLMDPQGTTRAASNHATDTSFVGGNFAFRPYFSDAIAGGEGRFFALGTTSRKRGYYFGAPVRDGGTILGVLVVKVDLDTLEETWANSDYGLIVTDPEGVVFLSSHDDWLFAATAPLTPQQQQVLTETRRYHDTPLGRFPQTGARDLDGHRLITLTEAGQSRDYLMLSEPMPDAGWTIAVLLDTAPAQRQATVQSIVAVLALGSLGMAIAVLLQRRARLHDRTRMQQAAQAELEQRVQERTAALALLNQTLNAEVGERRLAEQNLRQAQTDLIQAAKLAALGQMSAALSHEFNQPLGALRNYAENAQVLLDRDRLPEVRDNIGRILAMVDRMSAIGRHLRSFARKPGQKLVPVDLAEVVEAAQEIAALRLRAAQAELIVDLPAHLPPVTAGPVRLQQVLVNLIGNAADAVEGQADKVIRLSARATTTGVRLSVTDNGPGVPPALAERIFDPFFSTKTVGKGLGLGLSISYNIIRDFGGSLSLDTAADGGAAFHIDLRLAQAAVAGRAA